jgi:nitrate reductase delta subunit
MKPYQLFAEILEYPGPRLPEHVSECRMLLPPAVARFLQEFQMFVEQAGDGQIEELYTSTFDMQSDCSLYIGYQIFGEDRRRGLFMAKLREDYREHGFSDGGELPDHLPVILRYLAVREPDEMTAELVAECVMPALAKLIQALEAKPNPYASVLRAVSVLLKTDNQVSEPIEPATAALEQR